MTQPVTLYDQLRAVILEALTGHDPDKVTPSACLREDLGCTDTDKIEVMLAVEEFFDCEISDDDADHVRTVGDLLDLVQRKQRAAA